MEEKYRVLGLEPGASEAKIKETYAKLQKMYDPDKFPDAGQKKYARERLEEFRKAYNDIMNAMQENTRKAQGSSSGYSYSAGGRTARAYDTQKRYTEERTQTSRQTTDYRFSSKREFYSYVRRLLQKGGYTRADDELSRYPAPGEAEWNFLKGSVLYYTGYVNQAYDYFREAVKLAPSNQEYSRIFNRMRQSRGGTIRNTRYDSRRMTDDSENLCENEDFLCQMLICMSCLRGR